MADQVEVGGARNGSGREKKSTTGTARHIGRGGQRKKRNFFNFQPGGSGISGGGMMERGRGVHSRGEDEEDLDD